MSTTPQTIAFFGATGGCACSALAHALLAGHHCTALVRTPTKLVEMLTSQHSIPSSTLDSLLTITQGDSKDPAAVSLALVSPTHKDRLVDHIVSGLGGEPRFQLNPLRPLTLTDPTICADSMHALWSALGVLRRQDIERTADGRKPLLTCVSSTGVSRRQRDVPLSMLWFYKWFLPIMHADKRKMEEMAVAAQGEEVRDFVVVRPSHLEDYEARGLEKVRVGWEWGEEGKGEGQGPAIGFTVGRRDVGEWIFRRVVKEEGAWEGKCVSLTY
ncbi:hypothetical protein EJ04DRAFT_610438 [Polyplosphaeria fusca]|uniref:NAD(P)-binding domain-containing protein n=1 Tax=Polyplosphaeria fusca TaxID=682080 RepID=A0A9P4QUW2_9PLEO|nr:hypothetical protein EJ04DRAFT_610438 [Polyplosphaeria fusca]